MHHDIHQLRATGNTPSRSTVHYPDLTRRIARRLGVSFALANTIARLAGLRGTEPTI